jgi:uncharacterized protein (DUF58 family)
VTFDTAIRSMLPARSAPGHFSTLCKTLESAKTGGEAPLSGILHALAEKVRRRGLIIVMSDGFDNLDDLTSALGHLRHRRHEVLFFQILAPEEEEFPFRKPARFRNLERLDHLLRIDPAALRTAYLEKFNAHCKGLKEKVQGMNADYHRVTTAVPPDRALLDYLAARSSRRGGGR